MLAVLPQGCRCGGGQSLPPTGTPVSPYTQGPKTSGLMNFRRGSGILGPQPRRSMRESKLVGLGGGGPIRRGGGGVRELWAAKGTTRRRSSFQGGENGFFQQPQSLYCCTKGCIDNCERFAWLGQSWVCSAGSLRRPFARRAQTGPRLPSPCRSESGTGSEVADKHCGPRRPGPRSQGCPPPLREARF